MLTSRMLSWSVAAAVAAVGAGPSSRVLQVENDLVEGLGKVPQGRVYIDATGPCCTGAVSTQVGR